MLPVNNDIADKGRRRTETARLHLQRRNGIRADITPSAPASSLPDQLSRTQPELAT
jgi:hypothetical protein